MYQIKAIPEDFRVVEESNLALWPEGEYCYLTLEKRNCTTIDAIISVANALRLPLNRIGYAGNKDKVGITEQLISIPSTAAQQLTKLSSKNFTLKIAGYGNAPITLGDLTANRFTIVVRNIAESPKPIVAFPNYFDSQRFSANNAAIGKLLLQRKFSEAAALIQHAGVQLALQQNPAQPLSALQKLPVKVLMLYVHAYQSLLFNRILTAYLAQFPHISVEESFGTLFFPTAEVPNIQIPLPGFGFACEDAKLSMITAAMLSDEGIAADDFVVRELPHLSCESIPRDAMAKVQNLSISLPEPDELHAGMKKCTVSFSLQKGSYATMAVRGMFV